MSQRLSQEDQRGRILALFADATVVLTRADVIRAMAGEISKNTVKARLDDLAAGGSLTPTVARTTISYQLPPVLTTPVEVTEPEIEENLSERLIDAAFLSAKLGQPYLLSCPAAGLNVGGLTKLQDAGFFLAGGIMWNGFWTLEDAVQAKLTLTIDVKLLSRAEHEEMIAAFLDRLGFGKGSVSVESIIRDAVEAATKLIADREAEALRIAQVERERADAAEASLAAIREMASR